MRGRYVARQAWANRIVPPFVFVMVLSCVWYALASRPHAAVVLPVTQHIAAGQSDAASTASVLPVADIAPTVSHAGAELQFSVDTKPFQQVQKVEFYVENKFVGAAFAQPFTVNVSENDLTAGTHTVTAKVYTATTTAQTTPALFTANPTAPPPTNSEDSEVLSPVQATPTAGPSQPAPSPMLASPTNLAAIAADDDTSAQLQWNASSGATAYQIWRDGTQIGTVAATTYTDTGLTPGQTYDYKVVAVDGDGNQSDPSTQVGVTMPVPAQPDSSQAIKGPSSADQSLAPTVDTSAEGADQ